MDEAKLEHLQPRVQQILVLIANAIAEALGKPDFERCWIVLYGSAAQPENWVAATSDLNLLCVLDDSPSLATLEQVHDAIEPLRRMWPMTLELTSRHELTRSTDVFPLKYLDIQRHHVVLHGPAHALGELEIAWDHLRLRLEQSLKALLAELRHVLPQSRDSPELLVHLIDDRLARFWQCLSALLFLRQGDWWVSSRHALIDAARDETLEIDASVLEELDAIRHRTRHPDAASLYHTVAHWHEVVAHLADVVDHLDQRQELAP